MTIYAKGVGMAETLNGTLASIATKRIYDIRDQHGDGACLICHENDFDPESDNTIFCKKHMSEYTATSIIWDPSVFALTHSDNHQDHPAIGIARWVRVFKECPRCEQMANLNDDYICERCRFG